MGKSSAERSYTLEGRVRVTKNSRALANGRSYVNPVAKRWLEDARQQLALQHTGDPLEFPHSLSVIVYFRNKASWPDADNALASICDALKKIVIKDDAPAYLPKMSIECRLSRQGKDYAEVRLEPIF